jgi:hypothetical protein
MLSGNEAAAQPKHEQGERACVTRAVGFIDEFGECRARQRAGCPYFARHGTNSLCYHPNWRDFDPVADAQTHHRPRHSAVKSA